MYKTSKFDIHHFDFYRLHEAGLMEHELQGLMNDKKVVVVVEWGEVVKHVLPEERLHIEISQSNNEGREFYITCHQVLEYLLEKQATP